MFLMRDRGPWNEDRSSARATRVAVGLVTAVVIATAAYIGYLLLTGGVAPPTAHG